MRKVSSVAPSKPIYLTDMLLHFTRNEPSPSVSSSTVNSKSKNASKTDNSSYIISADTILSILDRSVDLDLLKKYKLTVAEKYDDSGSSTFFKYGSLMQDDYVNFFDFGEEDIDGGVGGGLFSSSNSSSSGLSSSLLTRLVLLIACFLLSFLLVSTVVVFYCMKRTYKRKLRAERAMVKAFGLEQTSMMTYNDSTQGMSGPATVGGYLNMAFDSNSLLPIPGTNLYAYEGSNPMWLKKYEKVSNFYNEILRIICIIDFSAKTMHKLCRKT